MMFIYDRIIIPFTLFIRSDFEIALSFAIRCSIVTTTLNLQKMLEFKKTILFFNMKKLINLLLVLNII